MRGAALRVDRDHPRLVLGDPGGLLLHEAVAHPGGGGHGEPGQRAVLARRQAPLAPVAPRCQTLPSRSWANQALDRASTRPRRERSTVSTVVASTPATRAVPGTVTTTVRPCDER